MKKRIGFMQGRLVDKVDGKIQSFPSAQWRDEFPIAQRIGIPLMEWTLDDYLLAQNPFCTAAGQQEIQRLSKTFGLTVTSLTGDCFMQAPFWKHSGIEQAQLLGKLDLVIDACAVLRVRHIVIPLVDNGQLDNAQQTEVLHSQLMRRHASLLQKGVQIAFESDYAPAQLQAFIALFPADSFGVNYDIGNSASLGFDPTQELQAYAPRITNVHVKDRILGGTTVALGTGAAKMDAVFSGLHTCGYAGNFILQTARAADSEHEKTLLHYKNWTLGRLERYFGS